VILVFPTTEKNDTHWKFSKDDNFCQWLTKKKNVENFPDLCIFCKQVQAVLALNK